MSNPPTHPTTTRPCYDLPLVAHDGLPLLAHDDLLSVTRDGLPSTSSERDGRLSARSGASSRADATSPRLRPVHRSPRLARPYPAHADVVATPLHVLKANPEADTVGPGPEGDVILTDHRLKATGTSSGRLASSAHLTQSKHFFFVTQKRDRVNGRDFAAEQDHLQLHLRGYVDLHHRMQHYSSHVARSLNPCYACVNSGAGLRSSAHGSDSSASSDWTSASRNPTPTSASTNLTPSTAPENHTPRSPR
jgi:hypothetical protein